MALSSRIGKSHRFSRSKRSYKLLGSIPNELQAYVDADVVVYPSVDEIFGLVPFEAILCGTSMIVTDDCGCGQLIAEVKCGFVVREGHVAELKATIEHLFDNPAAGTERTARGKNISKKPGLEQKSSVRWRAPMSIAIITF
jgi:glycosyltransferase involved in cell wall biosynthesis